MEYRSIFCEADHGTVQVLQWAACVPVLNHVIRDSARRKFVELLAVVVDLPKFFGEITIAFFISFFLAYSGVLSGKNVTVFHDGFLDLFHRPHLGMPFVSVLDKIGIPPRPKFSMPHETAETPVHLLENILRSLGGVLAGQDRLVADVPETGVGHLYSLGRRRL